MTAAVNTSFFALAAPAAASHSLVRRLPAGADVKAGLAAAVERFPFLKSVQLWDEQLRTDSTDTASQTRRTRELSRPVDGKRTPVRAIVLTYADGVADLALVAHRAVVDGRSLAALADLLTDPTAEVEIAELDRDVIAPADRTFAPVPWGLGNSERTGHHGVVSVTAPLATKDAIVTALETVLARYGDTSPFAVLVTSPDAADDLTLPEQTSIGLVHSGFGGGYAPHLAPAFPVTFSWHVEDAALHGELAYDKGFVEPAVAAQFAAHVAKLVADPTAELVDDAEAAALVAIGRTAGTFAPRTIHETFAEIARRDPAATALSDADSELSYGELDARSAAVAGALRELGVQAGDRVGVCLERTAELVVTLLGVLRAGASYVPMDPAYPAERLSYTVSDAGIAVVVTTAENFPAAEGVRLVAPADLVGTPGDDVTVDPSAIAYVIYTSGSTGRPKGVAVPHQNVAALLAATAGDMRLGPADVWTLFHSSAFDFSVWEIWGSLLTGAHLVVVPYWVSRSPEEFHDLLVTRGVTVLNQTPSAFAAVRDIALRSDRPLSVRLVVFGGEPLDVRLLEPWFRQYPHTRCRVVNMFGITETTVHVTTQTITPAEVAARSKSVGRALPGWSVSVRDENGRPRPFGVPGEIYVGGAGVASHYLNLADLTADRFVIDPVDGQRVYRSGDLGLLHPDGRLDHLGRIDSQVKVRGFRIELDEIRSVLLDDAAVSSAVVVLNAGDGDAASARLDAYFVGTAEVEDVRRRAARFLPEHMVPATFTKLDEIPLTVNGKTDVARLVPAAPVVTEVADAPREEGLLGDVLAAWREVLGTAIGADDDFFEVGGNSLLAVKLSGALRRAGLPPVSLRELYVNPTPADLTALLATRQES
jgi:amino acid adenylation domain-containing protein